MNDQMWFGREPALVIQSIGAVLSMLVAFSVPGLNDRLVALILAVISAGAGTWAAVHVRPIGPAAFTGFVGAAAALAGEFGLHATQQQLGLITAAAVMVATVWARGQITPTHSPVETAATGPVG